MIYGKLPPQHTSLEDLCGPALSCPECPATRNCKNEETPSPRLPHLQVTPFTNVTLPGLKPRATGNHI